MYNDIREMSALANASEGNTSEAEDLCRGSLVSLGRVLIF